MFALDSPTGDELRRIERVSGWYLPEDGSPEFVIRLILNDAPYAACIRAHRPDVGAAFPQVPRAALCGFVGDLLLPSEICKGEQVTLTILAQHSDGMHVQLLRQTFFVSEDPVPFNPRHRSFDLDEILMDPESSLPASGRPESIRRYAGVPHFHPAGVLPIVRLTEQGTTHPLSQQAENLVRATKGMVLDFGAGIKRPDQLYEHVVNLDAIHFPAIDVVNTFPRLPFRDEVFDGVVSQAVFEHLQDPFFAAREVLRILKPGGFALIDTAFMQPFHGDPSHFFNMTLPGLREIMKPFEIEEICVRKYQQPSQGLIMQFDAVLPFMRESAWRSAFEELLKALKSDGDALDESLGTIGREMLAAGVSVLARKPS